MPSVHGSLDALRRVAPLGVLALVLVPVLRIAAAARLAPADLTINNAAEVTTLDPATVTGVPEGRVIRALFEGLFVKHPRTLEPLPGMAESYELSADGLTYTFHLRDARWTNGDPVTAQDFVYSWERLLAPETAAEYAYQLWYVQGAREYSRLPTDRLYTATTEAVWVERLAADHVRVGATGYSLGRTNPASLLPDWEVLTIGVERAPESEPETFTVPLRVGEVVEGDDTAAGSAREFAECAMSGDSSQLRECGALIATSGGHLHVPVSGRVTAVNAQLPATLGELSEDPYDTGWMLELELAAGHLDELVRRGALLDADTYRSQVFWPNAVAIRALDARTLEVELVSPTPYFLQLTASPPLFPVNSRNIEEAKARSAESWQLDWLRSENLVTNGPFRIVERRVNDRIRLVKNAAYWDADSVALDSIDVLAVESYATMLNLYLSGEVAWIDRVSTNLVHRLLPRDDFDPVPYLGSYFYRVNTTRPPFDDVRVRTALALAIDRRALCEKILKSGQQPSWSHVPRGMPGYPVEELRDPTPTSNDKRAIEARSDASAAPGRALDERLDRNPTEPRGMVDERLDHNPTELRGVVDERLDRDVSEPRGMVDELLDRNSTEPRGVVAERLDRDVSELRSPTEMAHARVGDDLSNYDAAFAEDLERAKRLIAEAGYGPGGKPFPTFEVHYNTSEAHRDIAEVVAAGWKEHLGLDARLLNQEWKVYLDTQRTLRFDVSRSSWIADYADPNSFLDPFVTGGPNNRTGFSNARYDECIALAAVELDATERMRLLSDAEAILLRELPILPIFSYVTQSVYDPRLGGFYDNALDEHFPKHWYWKDDAELAASRAKEPPGVTLAPAHGPSAGKYAVKHVPGQWD